MFVKCLEQYLTPGKRASKHMLKSLSDKARWSWAWEELWASPGNTEVTHKWQGSCGDTCQRTL